MKVTSYGAAQGVTGSKHLLEFNGHRVLLDCGMFQGARKQSDYKNRYLPFDARGIDAVILSHAHIDHSGIMPVLAKDGYQGPVYTTSATRDLCSIMLLDSANIQARDAEWLSQKNREYVAPLYDEQDVAEIMQLFNCVPYGKTFEPVPDLKVTFNDAGHVLGSAMIAADYRENGSTRRLIFTGDLGRKRLPILKDPWEPTEADFVIMESTYGDRDHDPIETMEYKLAEIVKATAARGGKIIIPTFALERAQEVIYTLKTLELRNEIPDIPVYVDSPLTVNITDVFRLHPDAFDKDMLNLMKQAGDPFRLKNIKYVSKTQDSMAINEVKGPAIVMSAAGMCEHGRILHHLKNNCTDPRNTILIVGFQAKNTLGRRIVERDREIKIFGVNYPLNAEVRIMNGFSAHAGRSELLEFAKRLVPSAQNFMLVHGENSAIESLRDSINALGAKKTTIMAEETAVELN
jgi:metallo-beta-lactamase family protein